MQHTSKSLKQLQFYGILDTGYVDTERWEKKCLALLEGGAGVVQLRAKRESSNERRALLERILPFFEETDVHLIVNDDLDLAVEFSSVGLHVGQDDVCPREARERLGPEPILGLSTHSLIQARSAEALADILDYFAVGPVFPTGTKPDYKAVGLDLVREVQSMKPSLPFFCIGGIHQDNVVQVRQAGGQGVVAVSAVLCAEDTAGAVNSFCLPNFQA